MLNLFAVELKTINAKLPFQILNLILLKPQISQDSNQSSLKSSLKSIKSAVFNTAILPAQVDTFNAFLLINAFYANKVAVIYLNFCLRFCALVVFIGPPITHHPPSNQIRLH